MMPPTFSERETTIADIVIVGGGIGGLALALMASRIHLNVVVLDRRSGPTASPFPTTIGPRGLALLDTMGLLEPLAREDVYPCDVFRFFSMKNGRALLHADYRQVGFSRRKGFHNLIVDANILESLLIKAVGGNTPYEPCDGGGPCDGSGGITLLWGAEFSGLITEDGLHQGVSYRHEGKFCNIRARLIVGADGSSSPVRRVACLPTKTKIPKARMFILSVRRPKGFNRDVRYYLGTGETLGLFPRSTEDMVLLYMNTRKPFEVIEDEGVEQLTARLAQIDPVLQDVLTPITGWESVKAAPCPTVRVLKWGAPGLVVMGDAAHTLSPHMAQGATQAMLDAEAIAALLCKMADNPRMPYRLPVEYERIRKPDMDRLHRIAWEYELLWEWPNPIVVALRDHVFRNVSKSTRLLKKVLSIEGGLTTHGYSLIERLAAVTGIPLPDVNEDVVSADPNPPTVEMPPADKSEWATPAEQDDDIGRYEPADTITQKDINTKNVDTAGETSKKQPRSKLFRLLIFLGCATLSAITLSVLLVLCLRWVPPPTSAFMVQRQWASVLQGKESPPVHYKWVDWELISPWMPLAVVAAEDQKFFHHQGFDFDAITKAIEKNKQRDRLQKVLPQRGGRPLRKGRPLRGASTITQQVAKNLFLWPGRSYLRKGCEAYFTVLLESLLTKERILEVYVNIAEFGDGIYGIGAAAEQVFKKSPQRITRREAALLAAVLPSPKRFKAKRPSAYVIRRVRWIERQMRQLGGPEYVKASDENIQGTPKDLLRDLTNAYFLLQ